MKQKFPFHPILFACSPILLLYAQNMAVVSTHDLIRPLAVALGICLAIWLPTSLVLRSWDRAAICASLLSASFFLYADFMKLVFSEEQGRLVYSDNSYVLGIGIALLTIASAWKWKLSLTPFFNATAVALMVILGLRLVQTQMAISGGVRSLTRGGSTTIKFSRRPDIFYIVLDGYGRSDALKTYIEFDNSKFIQSLGKSGFYVVDQARSNYVQTEQSLSSSLNMEHLSDLVKDVPKSEQSRALFDKLISNSSVASTLRGNGYRIIQVATGFEQTKMATADLMIESVNNISLFEAAVMNQTPLPKQGLLAGSAFARRYAQLTSGLEALGKLGPKAATPRFVFAHIVAPHPPFVIDEAGAYVRPKTAYGFYDGSDYMSVGGTIDSYKEGYRNQAKYVTDRILEVIEKLQSSGGEPPIIIVQGDHGSKSRLYQNDSKLTDVRESMRNLNALFVPEDIRKRLYPGLTPVNSFRIIFGQLSAQPLPLKPDTSFFSPWSDPFKFEDVTDRVNQPLPQ